MFEFTLLRREAEHSLYQITVACACGGISREVRFFRHDDVISLTGQCDHCRVPYRLVWSK